jgi:hypothetical protein
MWNVEETTRVVALLKQVRPDITVVLGGPEVNAVELSGSQYFRPPLLPFVDRTT